MLDDARRLGRGHQPRRDRRAGHVQQLPQPRAAGRHGPHRRPHLRRPAHPRHRRRLVRARLRRVRLRLRHRGLAGWPTSRRRCRGSRSRWSKLNPAPDPRHPDPRSAAAGRRRRCATPPSTPRSGTASATSRRCGARAPILDGHCARRRPRPGRDRALGRRQEAPRSRSATRWWLPGATLFTVGFGGPTTTWACSRTGSPGGTAARDDHQRRAAPATAPARTGPKCCSGTWAGRSGPARTRARGPSRRASTRDEDARAAARASSPRSSGSPRPTGRLRELGTVRSGGKGSRCSRWRATSTPSTSSATPSSWSGRPGSGRTQAFPEVDRAAWFDRTPPAARWWRARRSSSTGCSARSLYAEPDRLADLGLLGPAPWRTADGAARRTRSPAPASTRCASGSPPPRPSTSSSATSPSSSCSSTRSASPSNVAALAAEQIVQHQQAHRPVRRARRSGDRLAAPDDTLELGLELEHAALRFWTALAENDLARLRRHRGRGMTPPRAE